VGVYRSPLAERFWRQVDEALDIVERYDLRTFRRLRSDVARIVVIPSRRTYFSPYTRTCYLKADAVNGWGNGDIACSLVHEAVHARLRQKGLAAFALEDRERAEELCVDEQIGFVRRLPEHRFHGRDKWLEQLAEVRRTYPPTQAWPPKSLSRDQRRNLALLLAAMLILANVDRVVQLPPALAVTLGLAWCCVMILLIRRMVLAIY